MSLASWPNLPSDFPQFFLVGSVSGGQNDNTIRTTVGTGRDRVRKRFANPTERYTGALLFQSQAAYAAFLSFFNNTVNAGQDQFTWVHPITLAGGAILRFVGPFTAQPITPTAVRVTVTVEILPS